MLSNVMAYHRPASIAEAVRLIRRRGVCTVPLAGGTSLLARPDAGVQAVVDLSGLGLDYVRQGGYLGAGRLEIGAMTTLQSLATSPIVADVAGGLLATAARHTATRTVRNTATIGGSIAACGPSTDIVVALLALAAEVMTGSGRVLTVEQILENRWPSRRPRLYTEVHLYERFTALQTAFCRVARLPSDQAIVNVAVALSMADETCLDIRLAAGGVAPKPLLLRDAEALLIGTRLNAANLDEAAAVAMEAVNPPSDTLGSSDYRRAMLGVLVKRAVQRALAREMEQ